jgi:biopolymer transport protein ExbD
MSMSGPSKTHHHDDDDSPGVFAEINITPLTDIFLVLLIIFMVTSTAIVEQGQSGAGAGVRVDLPKGAAKEIAAAQKDFPVAVLSDGRIVIEGKVVEADVLKARLLEVLKLDPQTQVIIQADTAAQHGKVVEVMEVAKLVGVQRLAISTESDGK